MDRVFYGARCVFWTVCRPLKANVPDMPGGILTVCPYCHRECWKTPAEQSHEPLPDNYKPACTACSLKRAFHQREMDATL
jgi:hypothetical protein